MPQLRQNIITGDWVVIAPERAKRPSDFVSATQPASAPSESCVFCPESDNYRHQRLKGFETDHVYVLPNKFPAFVEDPKQCSPRSYKVEEGFFVAKPAVGGHDVVIIKDHQLRLHAFPRAVWRDLLVMFRRRYRHYAQVCNAEHIMAIYNEQAPAGASILHPHAQIFASSVVSNLVAKELTTTEAAWNNNGSSAFADLVAHEERVKERLIAENSHYLAFTQYAAKFPFEIWIVPKYQQSHFEKTTDAELAALIPVLMTAMKKLNTTLHDPPLNFFIHSAPTSTRALEYYRWHIEITPRLGVFGGFELGSGIIIDVISPEQAAGYLNETKK